MRLYLDTIDAREAAYAINTGLIYGLTSNPFLFEGKTDKPLVQTVSELLPYAHNELHVQVPGRTGDEYLKNGLAIYELDPKRIIIKIPVHREGLNGIKLLKEVGVRVTATAVTTSYQAILVGLLNVDYVAPFVTRISEAGYNGLKVIRRISKLYQMNNIKTLIIAASIRSVNQIIGALDAGAHAVTVKYPLFIRLLESPLSNKIIAQMNDAWNKIKFR